jgi:multidrug efflux pump subunit AcrA (membrane-fusion protein)
MSTPLFRRAAIEHQKRRGATRAELLSIDPTANAWGTRLVAVGLFFLVGFLVFGRINEYATGPAVVRLSGRSTVTSPEPALVHEVRVLPGQRVKAGDVLVLLRSEREQAELQALTQELDDQLVKVLMRPEDLGAREALVSLRARRDVATQRLDSRVLRAKLAGIVGDVRARAGQMVEPGMSLVEVLDESATVDVLAVLPGRYRPYLRQGAELRFELDGFPRMVHALSARMVSDQIVGPREAARAFGVDLADALAIEGPVVLVEGRLPAASFVADGRNYRFAHGMVGKLETVVRDERLAFTFIPALKTWFERMEGDELAQGAAP